MLIVIICSLIGGVISLIGGLIFLTNKKLQTNVEYLTAFAGGALLAAAFSDLLPEAVYDATNINFVIWGALFGLLFFFLLETILAKFTTEKSLDAKVPMIVIGDAIHNFVDGIAIAAGFLISPLSGIVVTLAIAAHEIPQEIGEFALLFKKNMRKKKIVIVNILSSLTATFSAALFYYLGDTTNISLTPLLSLVAGFFIYLAVSDIIPSLNQENNYGRRVKKALVLILSTILISFLITSLHSVAALHEHHNHDHDHSDHETEEQHLDSEITTPSL